MSRLDDYRAALLAAHDDVCDDELRGTLDERDESFAAFVINHGLGPLWYARTGDDAFRESRFAAEALYSVQENALRAVAVALDHAGIEYVAIKGVANRELLYDKPALRACLDIDLLVRPADKIRAAMAIANAGYRPAPELRNISRVIVLVGTGVDIDLHWSLLREGRLRSDLTGEMLDSRRKVGQTWALSSEHTLFALLVHPAFVKHLEGWGMGMHRVADVLEFLRTQEFDSALLFSMLEATGVRTAAWATLRWAEMLAGTHTPTALSELRENLAPRAPRRWWLEHWLANDWSSRTNGTHLLRLLGFSVFLHDSLGDALRAFRGRRRAAKRAGQDLAAFSELLA